MKKLALLLLFYSLTVYSAQKGTVNVPEADIYSDEDFDAEVIENVKRGETYLISNKTYGAFYKIKLKSGKIGYIADYQLDINGKPFQEKPFRTDGDELSQPKKSNKSKKSKQDDPVEKEYEDDDDDLSFKTDFSGVTLQLINFHEETLGTLQVDNLYAVGYKKMNESLAWEVFVSPQAPKYYAEKSKGSVEGFHIWGLSGFNTLVPVSKFSRLRYGGSLMLHGARTKVTTPTKSYELQDITLGAALEGAYVVQIKKVAFEISLKYFFDRDNYGGLGLSLLF